MQIASAAMASDRDDREDMRDVLQRLSEELRSLAAAIDANQATLAGLAEPSALTPDYVAAVQRADLLAQCVSGTADFLTSLSSEIGVGMLIDTLPASAGLKVEQLVERIGHPRLRRQAAVADEIDGFELF